MNDLAALKIPVALRPRAAEIIEITDTFCAEYLDAEYGELCRRLIARLARKRPSPLERGEPRIWAAGAVYELGSANFLFDRSLEPFMTAGQLAAGLGVAKTTMSNKARRIRDVLDLGPMEPELYRRASWWSIPWRGRLGRRLHRRRAAAAARAAGRGASTG